MRGIHCKFYRLNSLLSWVELLDLFAARLYAGAPLPQGITPEIIDSIFNISTWQIHAIYNTTTIQRLAIGRFVGELYQNMIDKISGTNKYKYMLFSGHDTTLAPLLSALNIFGPFIWPPYASNLAIELVRDTQNQFYVSLKYNFIPIIIPGCKNLGGLLCPIGVFGNIINEVIPSDWETECMATDHTRLFTDPTYTSLFC